MRDAQKEAAGVKPTKTSAVKGKGKEKSKGPNSWVSEICVDCLRPCPQDETLRCEYCDDCFHPTCVTTSSVLKDNLHLINELGWSCKKCRSDLRRMLGAYRADQQIPTTRDGVTQPNDKIPIQPPTTTSDSGMPDSGGHHAPSYASVTASAEPQGKTVPAPTTKSTPSITATVHEALNDAMRRKKNIIISGLPEHHGVSDSTIVAALLASLLTPAPPPTFVSVLRLGRPVAQRGRKLLVRFSCEQIASVVLQSARRLRHSSDSFSCSRLHQC